MNFRIPQTAQQHTGRPRIHCRKTRRQSSRPLSRLSREPAALTALRNRTRLRRSLYLRIRYRSDRKPIRFSAIGHSHGHSDDRTDSSRLYSATPDGNGSEVISWFAAYGQHTRRKDIPPRHLRLPCRAREGSSIHISAQCDNRYTRAVTDEIYAEVRRMRDNPPRPQELERLKFHAASSLAEVLNLTGPSIMNYHSTAPIRRHYAGWLFRSPATRAIASPTPDIIAEMTGRAILSREKRCGDA